MIRSWTARFGALLFVPVVAAGCGHTHQCHKQCPCEQPPPPCGCATAAQPAAKVVVNQPLPDVKPANRPQ